MENNNVEKKGKKKSIDESKSKNEKISTPKKVAKKTMTIVFENIWFSLIVKFTILVLSAFGITNMWIAVFGDVGVAILAILNAMRVNSKYNT